MDDEYTIKKDWYRIYQQHMINTGLWSEQNKELDFMGEQFKNINNERKHDFTFEEILPQKYCKDIDFEQFRQKYLNEIKELKQNGTLSTPDIADEKVIVAVFCSIYQHFYDKAIEQNIDEYITIFTRDGEKTFSLLEALTYIKLANKW